MNVLCVTKKHIHLIENTITFWHLYRMLGARLEVVVFACEPLFCYCHRYRYCCGFLLKRKTVVACLSSYDVTTGETVALHRVDKMK